MLNKYLFLWILIPLILSGCQKLELEVDVPGCIKNKIREFKKSDIACEEGARVTRALFQMSMMNHVINYVFLEELLETWNVKEKYFTLMSPMKRWFGKIDGTNEIYLPQCFIYPD